VAIEGVRPEIDGGRFAIKRTPGETVVVEATVFADGYDELACRLRHRHTGDAEWTEVAMVPLGNDRWRGEFIVTALGRHLYTVEGWVDHFLTWRRDLGARVSAKQDVGVEMLIGAALIDAAAQRASGDEAALLGDWARALRETPDPRVALDEELAALAARHPDRSAARRHTTELAVDVDRERARFSAWYEVFPRSCAPEPGRHGTLRDCAAWLPDIAAMGFDVVYLPPIHPIGRTHRKGPNNVPVAGPGDVGSPWAIGAAEGGHTAVHPDLGTIEDFRFLVAEARALGMEIALDLAYQCSPDHPFVTDHPEWFRRRPDGTIQYAENPPKKYQDIFPFDFECGDQRGLWTALRAIIIYWLEQGVRIFRVDNPHTKALPYWEWVVADLRGRYPDVIFLAEAFTRPAMMHRLAKLGFNQSYTYFTWRNSKAELTDYFTELTQTDAVEYFRPNLWPNTPDILHEYLQAGGRPAFMVRAVLAATLGANWGVYGPAFELCEREPREPGSEEYLHSEKYEIRQRDARAPDSLRPLLARLNAIRRAEPALQQTRSLQFHHTDNPMLICYSKTAPGARPIVTVANLDPRFAQSGWITLDLEALGLPGDAPFEAHDLLHDQRYLWQGPRNFVVLTPGETPAHIMRLRGGLATGPDFDPNR
jgi:starch synthase (maltosyl-transferring)